MATYWTQSVSALHWCFLALQRLCKQTPRVSVVDACRPARSWIGLIELQLLCRRRTDRKERSCERSGVFGTLCVSGHTLHTWARWHFTAVWGNGSGLHTFICIINDRRYSFTNRSCCMLTASCGCAVCSSLSPAVCLLPQSLSLSVYVTGLLLWLKRETQTCSSFYFLINSQYFPRREEKLRQKASLSFTEIHPTVKMFPSGPALHLERGSK